MTLDELNVLPDPSLGDVLRRCCGSSTWISAMIARKPFASLTDLLAGSDAAWSVTSESDWHEAFAHHPRIGDTRTKGWAEGEQSQVRNEAADVQDELMQANRDYEARFGHIYIVCATGKSAGEMLADARARMDNDPETELRIAAAEQHKITQLRLRKLLGETS